MNDYRPSQCDYCNRYSRTCGRDHTDASRADWARTWNGHARPTVTYYRTADEPPVTDEFDTDAEAHAFARHLAVDLLATPVTMTDSKGQMERVA